MELALPLWHAKCFIDNSLLRLSLLDFLLSVLWGPMKREQLLSLFGPSLLDGVALGEKESITCLDLVNKCELARAEAFPDELPTVRRQVIHLDATYWFKAGMLARLTGRTLDTCPLPPQVTSVYGDGMANLWRFGWELGDAPKPV